jgi:hypothetical protein
VRLTYPGGHRSGAVVVLSIAAVSRLAPEDGREDPEDSERVPSACLQHRCRAFQTVNLMRVEKAEGRGWRNPGGHHRYVCRLYLSAVCPHG